MRNQCRLHRRLRKVILRRLRDIKRHPMAARRRLRSPRQAWSRTLANPHIPGSSNRTINHCRMDSRPIRINTMRRLVIRRDMRLRCLSMKAESEPYRSFPFMLFASTTKRQAASTR